MERSRTINIFLPDGNPSGVKIVTLSNKIIKLLLIPRAELAKSKETELSQPAFYVLCDREGRRAYIGECENFSHRVKSHIQGKDFWEIALVFTYQTNSLDKADVKFLESLAVERAKSAGRMTIENANIPARNNLSASKTADAEEFFAYANLLISTIGFPVFEKVDTERVEEDELWFCSNKNTKAKGIYDEHGFTVLAGSVIDGTERPSFSRLFPYAADERRRLLTEKGLFDNIKNIYQLKEDITFKSPNQAGGFCVGGHMNAWTTWKRSDGRTMDEVLRKRIR